MLHDNEHTPFLHDHWSWSTVKESIGHENDATKLMQFCNLRNRKHVHVPRFYWVDWNTSGSLGEWEMLWEAKQSKCFHSFFTKLPGVFQEINRHMENICFLFQKLENSMTKKENKKITSNIHIEVAVAMGYGPCWQPLKHVGTWILTYVSLRTLVVPTYSKMDSFFATESSQTNEITAE